MMKEQKGKTKEATKKIGQWTFLSNHSHVLICLSKDPEMRLKDVAVLVGITERAVQTIVKDLVDASILQKVKTEGETSTSSKLIKNSAIH